MKKLSLLLLTSIIVFVQCKKKNNDSANSTPSTIVISDGLKYCESTLWNGNDLYITNFGNSGNVPNPVNTEGKGYITCYKNGKMDILIKADGMMNAPKGTALKGNYLFIADVAKVLVYDLSNLTAIPQIINFTAPFLNDLFIVGNTLYATETSEGKVYKIDITNLLALPSQSPQEYVSVPGANGIYVYGNTMYVASYNATGTTATQDNVIYMVDMTTSSPMAVKFITQPGFYDGLAISSDAQILYFTDWIDGSGANGKVGKINITTKKIDYYDVKVGGPARLTLHNDSLYIPDLPNSRVVVIRAD